MGQETKEAIHPPLDIPLVLSGTFGELRSNHFHAGIDIKTQRREGLPVYAVADGTVSRIKVGLWGYGKALYIAHPDGKTSVYAHLQKYGPDIESYVKKIQYQRESYVMETYPEYGTLNVKKGEIIGYSGNTGGSAGPHLHFEIRNSATQKPTNPLAYGLEVADRTAPVIQKIFAYPIGPNAMVNGNTQKSMIPFSKLENGTMTTQPVKVGEGIGLGLVLYDQQDMASNKNGVYQIVQKVDENEMLKMSFDTFSFGQTKRLNAIIDYEHYQENSERILKLFRDTSPLVDIDNKVFDHGIIKIESGGQKEIHIQIADHHGNQTHLKIPIQGIAPAALKKDSLIEQYKLDPDKPLKIRTGSFEVYFPKDLVEKEVGFSPTILGDTLNLNQKKEPLYKDFNLVYSAKSGTTLTKHHFITELLGSTLQPRFLYSKLENNQLKAKSRNMGQFTVMQDTTAPIITPKNFKEKQWLSNYRYLSLKITDDLSGIRSYETRVNGKWILMEYEPKTNTLTYNFNDGIITDTQWNLCVKVEDNVGNISEENFVFYRKEK